MRYFLIGFMGSGKSTLGKQLAHYLNIDFYDLDHYIEQNTQKTIEQIFKKESENAFRTYETQYLHEIVNKTENAVIATGGGTPCYNNNIEYMLENGIVIYLKHNAHTLAQRIIASKTVRPLVQQYHKNELIRWIEEKIMQREPYYSKANLIINASNIHPSLLIQYLKQLGFN